MATTKKAAAAAKSNKNSKGMNNSAKATSVAARIAALKAAGVSTEGMLSVADANGDGFVMRLVNGKLTMVDAVTGKPVTKAKAKSKTSARAAAKAIARGIVDNATSMAADASAFEAMYDDVERQIISNGYVKNTKLFRRWVMAQVFRMLRDRNGFNGALRRHGYMYQWEMAEEELRVLAKLHAADEECYIERSRFFTKDVIKAMFEDYLSKVTEYVNGLSIRHCRGREYKRLYGRDDIFVDEIDDKVFKPVRIAIRKVDEAADAIELYSVMHKYSAKRKKLENWDTPMCAQFVDAYKGEGAYYTMKNMVLFHDCQVVDESGQRLGKYQSMAYVNAKADEYCNGQGWKLFGVMKKLIEDNRETLGDWAQNLSI